MHAHHAFATVNVPQSLRSHVARPPCWQDWFWRYCGCAEFSDHSSPGSTLLLQWGTQQSSSQTARIFVMQNNKE